MSLLVSRFATSSLDRVTSAIFSRSCVFVTASSSFDDWSSSRVVESSNKTADNCVLVAPSSRRRRVRAPPGRRPLLEAGFFLGFAALVRFGARRFGNEDPRQTIRGSFTFRWRDDPLALSGGRVSCHKVQRDNLTTNKNQQTSEGIKALGTPT